MKIDAKVLIMLPLADDLGVDRLREAVRSVVFVPELDEGRLLTEITDTDILNTGVPVMDESLIRSTTTKLIESGTNLKALAVQGRTFDMIDTEAASARHLPILYSQTYGHTVAEHAIGLMICTAKRIQYTGQEFREGRLDYEMRLNWIGTELFGKTVGIVGLGHVGRSLAQKCQLGFDMRVLAYDPYIKRPISNGLEVELVDELSELLKESDFVCLTAILTEETKGIIGPREFDQMKHSAHLVNITPGLVNEGALIEALESATIAGAGLDAFDPDPPNDPQNPLFEMSNVTVTPHMAGVTKENQRRIALDNAEQIIAFLQGLTPKNTYWP